MSIKNNMEVKSPSGTLSITTGRGGCLPNSEYCEELVVAKAKMIRDRLIEAVQWKRKDLISKCLVSVYRLPLSKKMLAEIGLAHLVDDRSI